MGLNNSNILKIVQIFYWPGVRQLFSIILMNKFALLGITILIVHVVFWGIFFGFYKVFLNLGVNLLILSVIF